MESVFDKEFSLQDSFLAGFHARILWCCTQPAPSPCSAQQTANPTCAESYLETFISCRGRRRLRFEFSGPSELVLLAFDHASLETVCHDLGQNGSLRLTFQFSLRDGQISSLIHALQEELRAGCVTGEFYIRQLAATLIRYIASRYSNQSAAVAAFSPGGLPPNRLRFVIDHIHQHLRTRLLSKDLASLVQMSPQHFANLFRKSTGRAPHEYVVYERIEEAKRLLSESSMPLMDVSFEVGFANQSHFGDSFRHATGTTPKKYRQCFECFHPPDKTNRKAS